MLFKLLSFKIKYLTINGVRIEKNNPQKTINR
jgi:hypothetical protein